MNELVWIEIRIVESEEGDVMMLPDTHYYFPFSPIFPMYDPNYYNTYLVFRIHIDI